MFRGGEKIGVWDVGLGLRDVQSMVPERLYFRFSKCSKLSRVQV